MTSWTFPDGEPIASEGDAVRDDIEVVAADHALRIGARRSGHRANNSLDLPGDLLHLDKIGAEHLDADRRADACCEHVNPRPNRHRPGVRNARELERSVHLGLEGLDGY